MSTKKLSISKQVFSITEVAGLLQLSRARFYQLSTGEGVSPSIGRFNAIPISISFTVSLISLFPLIIKKHTDNNPIQLDMLPAPL